MDNREMRRERLRRLIAQLERDPWFTLPEGDLRGLVSDENLTAGLRQQRQLASVREGQKQAGETSLTDEQSEAIASYIADLTNARSNAVFSLHAIGRDTRWIASLKRQMRPYFVRRKEHQGKIVADVARLRAQWDSLDRIARHYFERPKPNIKTALDAPVPYKRGELALHYPERSAEQLAQLAMLKAELNELEMEVTDETA